MVVPCQVSIKKNRIQVFNNKFFRHSLIHKLLERKENIFTPIYQNPIHMALVNLLYQSK